MVVKLNSGVDYRGNVTHMSTFPLVYLMQFDNVRPLQPEHCLYGLFSGVLACLDGYMNIAIEQTEEYVNGQLKNKYGDAFLRGNNGKIL